MEDRNLDYFPVKPGNHKRKLLLRCLFISLGQFIAFVACIPIGFHDPDTAGIALAAIICIGGILTGWFTLGHMRRHGAQRHLLLYLACVACYSLSMLAFLLLHSKIVDAIFAVWGKRRI